MKLLVVDDDAEIRKLIGQFLSKYGYEITLACDGNEMTKAMSSAEFDLIILDVMMPGDDGYTLCRRVRSQSSIPILMLSAVGDDTDRIVGLEMGADDYLAKPFNPRELLARVKAVLRRSDSQQALEDEAPQVNSTSKSVKKNLATFSFDGWRLEMARRRLISPDDLEIDISAGEFLLLSAFIDNPQIVLSRDQLLEFTHNRSAGPFDRSIDVQVSRLRQKIEEDPKNPKLIKTVRGGGYLFTPEVGIEAVSA